MPYEDQNHVISSREHKEGTGEPVPSFFHQLWALKVVIAGGLACTLIPIFFHSGLEQHAKFRHFLEISIDFVGKLGDALLIASILVLVIDDDARLRLIDTVVRAASLKMIGRHLPPSVQATVLRYFKINFYRPTFVVDYEFIPSTDSLKILARVNGTLLNCSPSTEDFKFAYFVDESILDPELGSPAITYVKVETTDGLPLFERDLSKRNLKQFDETVSLKPGTEYTTWVESVEFRPLTYFLPLVVGTTVVKATIRIRYPKNDFDVDLQLPNISGDSPIPTYTYFGAEWLLRNPILPGQCVFITWTPKNKTISAQTASVPQQEELDILISVEDRDDG